MTVLKRYRGLLLADPAYFMRMGLVKARARFPLDYFALRGGYAFSPIHLTLEVTHRCNLRCHMCDLWGREAEIDSIRSRREDKNGFFSMTLLEKLCSSFHLIRPVLAFGGGEPLMHPEIVEMVAMAKGKGFTCTLTTNGTLLEGKAAGLVESGLDSLVLSIDGPEEIHDSTRGVEGTFARARAGAMAILKARRRGRYSRPRLRLNCTINSRNFDNLGAMVGVAEDFGAESLVLSHLWFWDSEIVERHNRAFGDFCPVVPQNTDEIDRMRPDVIAREIEKIKKRRSELMVKLLPDLSAEEIRRYYGESTRPVKRFACKAVWLTGLVMPDGEIIPCLDYSYGNLNDRSFEAIWNGNRAREFRRRVRRAGIFPACVRCCMLYAF